MIWVAAKRTKPPTERKTNEMARFNASLRNSNHYIQYSQTKLSIQSHFDNLFFVAASPFLCSSLCLPPYPAIGGRQSSASFATITMSIIGCFGEGRRCHRKPCTARDLGLFDEFVLAYCIRSTSCTSTHFLRWFCFFIITHSFHHFASIFHSYLMPLIQVIYQFYLIRFRWPDLSHYAFRHANSRFNFSFLHHCFKWRSLHINHSSNMDIASQQPNPKSNYPTVVQKHQPLTTLNLNPPH